MADVYVNALTQTEAPAETDSLVMVNRTTNEGLIIDYNKLAELIIAKVAQNSFSDLDTTSKLLTGAINELKGELVPATTAKKGLVKPDGTTVTVDADGTIHGASSVAIATTSKAGIVKPDGTTITIDSAGTIKGKSATVDTALSKTSSNPVRNSAIATKFETVESDVQAVSDSLGTPSDTAAEEGSAYARIAALNNQLGDLITLVQVDLTGTSVTSSENSRYYGVKSLNNLLPNNMKPIAVMTYGTIDVGVCYILRENTSGEFSIFIVSTKSMTLGTRYAKVICLKNS